MDMLRIAAAAAVACALAGCATLQAIEDTPESLHALKPFGVVGHPGVGERFRTAEGGWRAAVSRDDPSVFLIEQSFSRTFASGLNPATPFVETNRVEPEFRGAAEAYLEAHHPGCTIASETRVPSSPSYIYRMSCAAAAPQTVSR